MALKFISIFFMSKKQYSTFFILAIVSYNFFWHSFVQAQIKGHKSIFIFKLESALADIFSFVRATFSSIDKIKENNL